MDAIRHLARELGLAGRVHFLGVRQDIRELIRASISTILPSEREGLPRSIMESLCLQVPVIGTDIRGIRDLLGRESRSARAANPERGEFRCGDCGLLVPVGDVAALAQAMDWILCHPRHALHMGRTGRAKVTAYDIQRLLKLHEQLYAEALEKRSVADAEIRIAPELKGSHPIADPHQS
jgi:glycosyltransferase involved in cell wall biosynthesis